MFRFIKQMFIELLTVFSIESFCVSLVSNSKEPIKRLKLTIGNAYIDSFKYKL